MILTETQASQLARALSDTNATGAYHAMTVDLYQTQIAVSPTTPLATFVAAIATYGGYAQGVITWDLPTIAGDGTVEVVGNCPAFRPTSSATPNGIWGCYLTTAGGALAFACEFDDPPGQPPLPMNSPADQILLIFRYKPATQSVVVVIA